MKTKKIIKELKYDGCGFPLILKNVPAEKIRGQIEPIINYKALGARVVASLSLKMTPLTGNQVKFIRLYFDLSLRDFASLYGLTHAAVKKWENYENDFANISPAIEKTIRLDSLFRLGLKPVEFYKKVEELKDIASTLHNRIVDHEEPLKIAV